MSFFSSLLSNTSNAIKKPHRRRRQRKSLRIEALEGRQMLAADVFNDLAVLSDEFDDSTTIAEWQRVNEVEGWNAEQLQQWDIDQTQAGRMVMQPHTVVWFQDWRGPMAFKEVTGDFVFTTRVNISDRDDIGGADADDVPGDGQFSLGGVMVRTPRDITNPETDWVAGSMVDDGSNDGENYVFLSVGYGFAANEFSLEVKTTRNSNSQLQLTPLGIDANVVTVQTARIGDSLFMLYQRPGEEWQVHRRYSRPDMPETLQVGLVTYTDWEKANDFDPFVHNGSVLTADGFDPTPAQPFNPDLVAGFEYARYVRPVVPAALDGIELLTQATDEQLLSFLGDHANTPADSSFPVVGDQVMPHSQSQLDIDLPASLADGTPLSYSVRVVGSELYDLDQQYGLFASGNYYENWGGQQEKWMQGDSGWYFILPTGDFGHWEGSFEQSPILATLDPSVYDDPSLLHDAPPTATATIADDVLTIAPVNGFVGQFDVELTSSTATDSSVEQFTVSVVNEAPVLSPIGDQTMPWSQDTAVVELSASDPDGDTMTLAAAVVQPRTYQLDQEYGFTTNGDYYEDWGGQQERWIRDGSGGWFYLLPGGELRQWGGDFGSSPLIAELGPDVYDDPTLLTDAEAIPASVSLNGNLLTIDPQAGYVGSFSVEFTASDGVATTSQVFMVSVTNTAPVLAPIPDQTMTVDQTSLGVALSFSDADGDAVSLTVEIIDEVYALDQSLGLTTDGNYYENWGGQQEKWIRDSGGAWYYLLPGGEFYRWEGSFESSDLLASLDTRYYDDPTRLTDAQPLAVTAYFVGDTLVVERDSQLTGAFQIRATATDGIAFVSRVFTVTIDSE